MDQYQVQASVWRERKKFINSDKQTRQYQNGMRKSGVWLRFDEDSEKEQFVTGLANGKTFDRLCEEEETKTLDNFFCLAQKQENSVNLSYVLFPPKTTCHQNQNGYSAMTTAESSQSQSQFRRGCSAMTPEGNQQPTNHVIADIFA